MLLHHEKFDFQGGSYLAFVSMAPLWQGAKEAIKGRGPRLRVELELDFPPNLHEPRKRQAAAGYAARVLLAAVNSFGSDVETWSVRLSNSGSPGIGIQVEKETP